MKTEETKTSYVAARNDRERFKASIQENTMEYVGQYMGAWKNQDKEIQRRIMAGWETDGPRVSPLGNHITRKDDKGEQPSGGDTIWTNTGVTRYGGGQHNTC